MPELPDVIVYVESLERRIVGRVLEGIRLLNPFILRTALPPIETALGQRVTGACQDGRDRQGESNHGQDWLT